MKNINLYIINTPFGYMVSMRKLHIKQGDTSEQYQYNILDKLYDVNCELIRELYCSQGEYETQEFIDSADACHCTKISWNAILLPLIVFKEEIDVEQFKKMLEAREILCQIKKQTES